MTMWQWPLADAYSLAFLARNPACFLPHARGRSLFLTAVALRCPLPSAVIAPAWQRGNCYGQLSIGSAETCPESS